MFTSDIIAVSNCAMCGDFLKRAREIGQEGVPLILREKDLSESEYENLAKETMKICPEVILHSFIGAAKNLGCEKIHLPMQILRTADLSGFDVVGASVHSAAEAAEAQSLGASYVTAGHIFATDCKKGAEPRGLEFLREVCRSVNIPVYAIGGITPQNAQSALRAGAAGVCVMSGLMRCADVREYIGEMRREND